MRGSKLCLLLLEPPSGRRELVILVFGGGPKLVSQIGSKADFKQHPHGMAISGCFLNGLFVVVGGPFRAQGARDSCFSEGGPKLVSQIGSKAVLISISTVWCDFRVLSKWSFGGCWAPFRA